MKINTDFCIFAGVLKPNYYEMLQRNNPIR